jgi:hypothetical protein
MLHVQCRTGCRAKIFPVLRISQSVAPVKAFINYDVFTLFIPE